MITAEQACDYIITRILADDPKTPLSVLKLQKLLYYSQAWFLAFCKEPLFDGRFEAWVHGPVHRPTYTRFRPTKLMYSALALEDRLPGFDVDQIPKEAREHIDGVLEVYAPFSDTQLESLTHDEEPWVEARAGLRAGQPSTKEISDETMRRYYSSRVSGA